MSLIDKLVGINKGKNVVIVESVPSNLTQYLADKMEVMEDMREISGRNLGIHSIPIDFARENPEVLRDSIVLINLYGNKPDLYYMGEAFQFARNAKAHVPKEDIHVLASPWGKPMEKAVASLLRKYANDVRRVESMDHSTSVLRYIKSNIGSILHTVGKDRNNVFLNWLSQRHEDGNLQTQEKRTFLFIGHKNPDPKGKFHFRRGDDLGDIDFSKYHGIIVDNNDHSKGNQHRFGEGFEVLDNLSQILRERGVEIPVLYQTAHTINHFSRKDIQERLGKRGAILIQKNLAPKVTSVEKAMREIEVSEKCALDEDLAKYTVRVERVGDKGYLVSPEGKAIVFSKAVDDRAIDDDRKKETLARLESEGAHRMYVLSLWHTRMHGNNAPVGVDFHEFDYIRDRIGVDDGLDVRLESLRDSYDEVVKKQRELKPRVFMHGDTKWDNWFGEVLGDYGSSGYGREYKDVARALISLRSDNDVDEGIENYIKIRRDMDEKFNDDPEEFKKEVYGSMITESLRIASYRVALGRVEEVDKLVSVAEEYARKLKTYSTIAKRHVEAK